jgi:hypothetical protein
MEDIKCPDKDELLWTPICNASTAHQFYSGFASGEREPDGLLLGLCFLGLAASPFAGEALGDLDLAGDLQKVPETTEFNIRNAALTT